MTSLEAGPCLFLLLSSSNEPTAKQHQDTEAMRLLYAI